MTIIILIILLSIAFLSVSYLAGFLVLLPFMGWLDRQSPNVSFFLKVHAGLWALTAAVATYYTAGKTVLSYLVLAYLYGIVKEGKKPGIKFRLEFAPWGLLSAVLICFVAWQAVRSGFFIEEIVYLGDLDYGIYITVAEYLRKTGIENPSPWYALAPGVENLPFTPYHYGDLWMNTLFGAWDSRIAPFYWYNLSFVPFLGALACFVCLVLVEELIGRPLLVWEKLLALILPFSVGWLYVFYPKIAFVLSPFIQTKFALAFLLIVSGILFLIMGHKHLFFFSLSFAFIVNVVHAPVLVGGAILFDWVVHRRIRWGRAYWALLAPIAYILCFYFLFGAFDTSAAPVFKGWQAYFLAAGKIAAHATIYFVIFNFPLFVIGYLIFRIRVNLPPRTKQVLLFVGCLYFCASFLWAAGNFLVESFQFYVGLAAQFAVVFYMALLSVALGQEKSGFLQKAVKVILAAQLFLSLVFLTLYYNQRQSTYSREFIAEAQASLSLLRPLGAYLPNQDALDVWGADPRMCVPCNFLKVIGQGYWAYSISVPENVSQTAFPERTTAIMAAPFYQYLQQLKEDGQHETYEQAQLSFLREARVDFIVVEAGARIPKEMRNIVIDEIEDRLSGTRILLLSRH